MQQGIDGPVEAPLMVGIGFDEVVAADDLIESRVALEGADLSEQQLIVVRCDSTAGSSVRPH